MVIVEAQTAPGFSGAGSLFTQEVPMPNTQFDSVLAKKLSTFLPLSKDELSCLAELQRHRVNVRRGQQLTREGQTGHQAFVLQAGWACSFKTLQDGGRQIISFPIAGDIVLRSVLLRMRIIPFRP